MSTPLDNWRWVPVEATEEMLAWLAAKNAAAREAAAVRDDPLRIRALEELAQLGYTVRDDLLYPPADGLREALEAYQYDAMRFRWLTEDHADPETRAKCRELLRRMAVMSYSAACADIDSAMAQATKREMLRTAAEWRRYQPTCVHGRYGDEDCADCPRTAAARAELGGKA